MSTIVLLCAGLLAGGAEPADQKKSKNDAGSTPKLTVGSPAPPFAVQEFFKGEPFDRFEKGQVYVVEFWATWCGPCIAVFPHLSELQKEYPKVTFVGVNIELDTGREKIAEFVKEQGERMSYRVAWDLQPGNGEPGKKRAGDSMSTRWMAAAEQSGIPSSFVVNGDGIIAAIRHPSQLDEVLPKVINGAWSIAEEKARLEAEQQEKQVVRELSRKVNDLGKGPVDETSLAEIDGLMKEHPKFKMELMTVKDRMVFGAKSTEALALPAARAALEEEASPKRHYAVASLILNSPRAEPTSKELKQLALALAEKSDHALDQKSFQAADVLAQAHFANGSAKHAVTVQERALALLEENPGAWAALKKPFQSRLEKYQRATEEAASK